MLDCPRLALLCALPCLLRAAVPGHRAEPLKRSAELPRNPRDPARGADFDRVYSGVVSLSTENIYSFNHTSHPGQAFDQAVTKDTCMAVGFLQRGVANFQLQRLQEAVSDFQLALAQLRGNAAIDYTQLGLDFKLQAWEVLYNMASVQCQAGLWTKAANTLVEAISKRPEGAQDTLEAAMDKVQKQVPLQLRQVPKGEVFQPPRRYLKHLEPMDFLGKAKVVASVIPDDHNSDIQPQQGILGWDDFLRFYPEPLRINGEASIEIWGLIEDPGSC